MCLWHPASVTRRRWLAHRACVACANPALRSSTATRHACGLGWVLRTGGEVVMGSCCDVEVTGVPKVGPLESARRMSRRVGAHSLSRRVCLRFFFDSRETSTRSVVAGPGRGHNAALLASAVVGVQRVLSFLRPLGRAVAAVRACAGNRERRWSVPARARAHTQILRRAVLRHEPRLLRGLVRRRDRAWFYGCPTSAGATG